MTTPRWREKRLSGDVVTMDNDYKEKLEMDEHVPVLKGVYITREDLEASRFTAKCSWCMSSLKGTARQAHTENCRRRLEEELRGTVKAEAAQRRVNQHQVKAAEENETNDVEPGGRSDGSAKNDEFHQQQQQRGSSIKL